MARSMPLFHRSRYQYCSSGIPFLCGRCHTLKINGPTPARLCSQQKSYKNGPTQYECNKTGGTPNRKLASHRETHGDFSCQWVAQIRELATMNPTFGIAPETGLFAASPVAFRQRISTLSLEVQNVRTRRARFSCCLRLDLDR